jgi:hypothetical protein
MCLPSIGDFKVDSREHFTKTYRKLIGPFSHQIVTPRWITKWIILSPDERAAVARRSKIKVRSGGFPNQTTIPPSRKFGQRLTGQGIGAF